MNKMKDAYINDLVRQKDKLKSIVKSENVKVTEDDTLTTLIDKVETLTPTKPYLPYISFTGCTVASNMFEKMGININGFDPSHYKYMFRYIHSGTLDLSNLDFSRIHDFENMIPYAYGNDKLSVKIKDADFSNATTMRGIFRGADYFSGTNVKCVAKNLKDISGPHGNKWSLFNNIYGAPIEYMARLFDNSVSPDTYPTNNQMVGLRHLVNNNDLSNLKDISGLFGGAYVAYEENFDEYLDILYNLDFSNLELMDNLFYSNDDSRSLRCKLLDFSNKHFKKLQKGYCFIGGRQFNKVLMGKCTSEDLTSVYYMFSPANSHITDATLSEALQYIDMSGWDLSSVTRVNTVVSTSAKYLETFYFGKNLGKSYGTGNNKDDYSISIGACERLSVESVLFIFNNIYDLNKHYLEDLGLSQRYTQKIDLHANVIAKLTPEQIAIATNKGWTVV